MGLSSFFPYCLITLSMNDQLSCTSSQVNKWTVAGTSIASQVRSLRKGNNDQVAIAIDMDPGSSGRLEDEDDDKGKPRTMQLLAFSSSIWTAFYPLNSFLTFFFL